MSERSDDSGAMLSGGQFLTPAEARQDAADRLVGQRTLLALRVVAIITVVVFVTTGILTDPDIVGIKSESLRMLLGGVSVLPGVAGLVALIVCRRPARRQVFWLREAIIASAIIAIIPAVIGLLGQFNDVVLFDIVLGVALVSGLTTLALLYIWRAR